MTCAGLTNRSISALLLLGALSQASAETCAPAPPVRAVEPVAQAWSIATQNLWRLMDERARPGADAPPSSELVSDRLDALATYIDVRLGYPHLLLVQEVENRGLLDRLAATIRDRGGPRYHVWLMEGQDPSGIDVAALSRSPVRIERMTPLFGSDRHGVHWLFSRPPLHLELAAPMQMDVVVVHLRSGRGLNDPDRGAGVQAKRRAQAARVAQWVTARRQAGRRIVVAGDVNSAPDAGVYSEPLDRLLEAPLESAWQQLPEQERFSYRYRCQPQAIDHVLMTDNVLPLLRSVQVTRGNAGHFQRLYDSNGVDVVSDHDALLVWLTISDSAMPDSEESDNGEER